MTAQTVKWDLLREVLTNQHAHDLTKGSPAHDPALKFTGAVVRHTQDEDFIYGMVEHMLPEGYDGNTLKEARGMIRDAIAKGMHERGERGDDEKKQSEVAIDAAKAGGLSFFVSPLGKAYAKVPGKHGGVENVPVHSRAFKDFVRRAYYLQTGKPPASVAVTEAIDHFAAMAQFDSPTEEIHVRVASHDGAVYYDLADEQNRAVKVTPNGRDILNDVPVNFVRLHGTVGALPVPVEGGDPEALRLLLAMDQTNFMLFCAFCIAALSPDGPYPILQIHGEHGAGKSSTADCIKGLLDPNAGAKLRMPRTEENLAICAQGHWVLNFDNVSGMSGDISDMLCTISTGGAFSTRTLYENSELTTFTFKRPVILNGIGNYATRADLQSRSIMLNLKAIPAESRKTEREMTEALAEIRPQFLGYLLDCVSCALGNIDRIEPPRNLRMADAAHWLLAAEPATAFPAGAMLEAMETVQREIMVQTAVDDILSVALFTALLGSPSYRFEGRFGQLHDRLLSASDRYGKGLPATPSALSSKVQRMQPSLRKVGLIVEEGQRSASGQGVILYLTQEGVALAREITDKQEATDDKPEF